MRSAVIATTAATKPRACGVGRRISRSFAVYAAQREGPDPEREGPDPEREGPDPEFEGPDPEREGPDPEREGPDPEREGPDPEREGPDPRREGLDPLCARGGAYAMVRDFQTWYGLEFDLGTG